MQIEDGICPQDSYDSTELSSMSKWLSGDELGRDWIEDYSGQFHLEGPVTLHSGEAWELPELNWNGMRRK